MLSVFADGIPRVPPIVMFRGKGGRLGNESDSYNPGIEVIFNENAYMNDLVVLNYIKNFLVLAFSGRPTLFSLDLMGSHKTLAVLEKFKSHNITRSLITGRCTSLIQLLDVAINKPFKHIMRELMDEEILPIESAETFHKWIIPDRRILTTTCVGHAFYRVHPEKADIIQRVFRNVGLSLPIDGSCDSELEITGFTGLDIANWREDFETIDEEAEILETCDNDEGIDFIPSQE